ncbi:GRIP and coiled-coil domain-containing protein 2-like [Mizuhopecten yessoensis]|uniref:GRIP and coiled-coil domain-containing protein 2-like n=1 Tax=Mizuhopecten yessoensis TaxID=6573 RepID=UPI000B45ECD7|nr:GRIP and coiled-coil domain-containing protein 2-like [Mizuhopecten yessoensis]
MADSPADGDGGTPGKSPASSKLDQLSREDMTKFVKKQMLMLQKSKVKIDELTKKMTELEASKSSGGDDAAQKDKIQKLEEELKTLEQEKADMLSAYQAVQQAQEQSISKFENLSWSFHGVLASCPRSPDSKPPT